MNPIWSKLKCLRFKSCTWTISSIIVTTMEKSSFWITHSITNFWIFNSTYFIWNTKIILKYVIVKLFYCNITLPVKGLSCQNWIACVSIFTNTLDTEKSFNSHTAISTIIVAFNDICVIITEAISNWIQSKAIYPKAKSLQNL